jgi:two-component system sensor histidine kinase/response regulator
MKTILLIDDDEAILDTFSLALKRPGRRVLTASSGEEGIAVARQHLPDLIISDINMPGTDGRSVLQAMRTDPQLATKQIVLMTGNSGAVTSRTGMNLGADDFLLKPFSLDDLLRCVEARLQRADLNWRVEDRVVLDLRSTLSSILPHELFTPLAGIIGLTEVLRAEFTRLPPAEIAEILTDIQQSGERLHRTLRNYLLLLELPSTTAGPPTETGVPAPTLRPALTATIDATLVRHGRAADATVDLADVSLIGDLAHLPIMLEELLDNACRFSRQGTPVEVVLRPDGTLSVTDAGRGMTAEQIERIGAFHQFERKKHEQQGLGLGLALVKKLAARCGATVAVTSAVGTRTTATVKFRVAS